MNQQHQDNDKPQAATDALAPTLMSWTPPQVQDLDIQKTAAGTGPNKIEGFAIYRPS